jgi:phosphoesterase RecJ-like protein
MVLMTHFGRGHSGGAFPTHSPKAGVLLIIPAMMDVYQQMLKALGRAKKVLVTTHVRPDGDALGTSCAMVLAMRKKGISAEVLLLSHLPTKYSFIFKDHGIVHHDAEKAWPASLDLKQFDLLLVCDTGTWSQLPGLKERVQDWQVPKLVLDHHLTQEDWADFKLVVTEAAAAGEIAAELIEQWDVKLDEAMATALFLAITTDTGWFQFSNTRPFTLRLAATLIEAGVDTDKMYQRLYQNERAERVALQSRAMQSMRLLADGRLAVMAITKNDFAETRAGVPDTENLINIPLQIAKVEASLLFTDPPEGGPIRCSLRSKGGIDVARFAEQFAGGGHARAAGLKVNSSLEEAQQRVVDAMLRALQ